MTIEILNNKKQWNDFLLAQPTQAGVFLQSWEWGEFQQAVGRKVCRYRKDGAFAQVIEMSLPFGKKYWYIPRGAPIAGLAEEARKNGVLFLRFEPVGEEKLQEITRDYKRLQEVAPIHPKQTLILDLSKSEDDLLAGMREKTRYNIRLAERRGIMNYELGIRGFNEFWKLTQETAKRDKFRTHPREYYEKMLLSMGTRKQGNKETLTMQLWIAYYNDASIAGAIVGYFGDTATYLHGASSYEHRALMGPYALHWDIIKDAKKQGYKYYDFWGIKTHNMKHRAWSNNWAGITRFKLGFGGEVVNYPGTFDLPLSKFWYKVYRIARRLLP